MSRGLLADLARLPYFRVTARGHGACRGFHLRWFREPDNPDPYPHWRVEFAERRTFDRWANSRNFGLTLYYKRKLYRPDVVAAHGWMLRVCRSGLFDFNRYFHTLEADGHPYLRNGEPR